MQVKGRVNLKEHPVPVLVTRQDMTGADRQWADRYEVDDLLRYTKAVKSLGVRAGDYARVTDVQPTATKSALRPTTDGPSRMTRAARMG